MNAEPQWVLVGDASLISPQAIQRFDHNGHAYAIYNLGGAFFATDGYCTHEQQHLAEGGVITDGIVECPLHFGQFDIATGEALAGPVCFNLGIYSVKCEGGYIYINPYGGGGESA